MVTSANLVLAGVIFTPVAWRKWRSWRLQKRTAQMSSHKAPRPWFSFPEPIWLPSNLLLSASFLFLVSFHLSYLFHPSMILSRSDIFLLTGTSVNAPASQVRSKVASMSFRELGWQQEWGEEGLETLLRRLGSFEGRKLHLTIGTSPFLSCPYCTSSKDYMTFSMFTQLWQLSIDLLVFGLLTLRFDSLDVIDEIIFSVFQMTTGRDLRPASEQSPTPVAQDSSSLKSTIMMRRDGYGYRTPFAYLLSCFIFAQVAIFVGLIDVTFGQGRWDHWFANYNMILHTALLASAFLFYFGQRTPHTPAMLEIAHLIKRARTSTDQTLGHLQVMQLTNQIIWSDLGLRERVSRWYDGQTVILESDESLDHLYAEASKKGIDTAQLQQDCRSTARHVWASTQPDVQALEQIIAARSHPAAAEPSTPLATSLSS